MAADVSEKIERALKEIAAQIRAVNLPYLDDLEPVLSAFARSIHAKAELLRRISPECKKPAARIREAISEDIKKCSDLVPTDVSVAAAGVANQHNVDLWSKGWHDQPSFDEGRQTYHREHKDTVCDIRDACCSETSESAIFAILKRRLCVVWVLKSEDDELTRLGYKHHREDPDKAYLDARITIAPRRTTAGHLIPTVMQDAGLVPK